ncbi:ABC transporter substrate-binding protein [Bradyrhizobium erythrophlei]|uniref:Putative ABC transport system substrate-binding protein n=1 Tax=Bradyrhizobium erythrophlei TaxID=1437360 RepID=A0A1M7U4V9_9BRAD|nr:ABC transporter substrate-binding protein [Bradyrhizobium erythrophlei]SHN77965.1 putative ABC transport system substrate-binding protein [Bradyrhizobium erythrophlei]
MKRRQFITLISGAATAWPVAARAQQQPTPLKPMILKPMPVVGYLFAGSPEQSTNLLSAFRKGLNEAGYIEGQNVTIEYRWAHADDSRLPELVADLVRQRVTVIVTPGSTPAALAAKTATTTIPIVFGIGLDPVRVGLVDSLNRPGGNVTGVSYIQTELTEKRLGLLHELLPKAARFAVLVNSSNPSTEPVAKEAQAGAVVIGGQVEVFTTATNRDIDAIFARLAENPADALLVNADPLFFTRRVQLVALAARHALPTMYPNREYVEIGGLMSYGPKLTDQFGQVGVYVGRILKGEKPADLPVMLPTDLEFVINLQTAKVIGLTVPPNLLARADEVIE